MTLLFSALFSLVYAVLWLCLIAPAKIVFWLFSQPAIMLAVLALILIRCL